MSDNPQLAYPELAAFLAEGGPNAKLTPAEELQIYEEVVSAYGAGHPDDELFEIFKRVFHELRPQGSWRHCFGGDVPLVLERIFWPKEPATTADGLEIVDAPVEYAYVTMGPDFMLIGDNVPCGTISALRARLGLILRSGKHHLVPAPDGALGVLPEEPAEMLPDAPALPVLTPQESWHQPLVPPTSFGFDTPNINFASFAPSATNFLQLAGVFQEGLRALWSRLGRNPALAHVEFRITPGQHDQGFFALIAHNIDIRPDFPDCPLCDKPAMIDNYGSKFHAKCPTEGCSGNRATTTYQSFKQAEDAWVSFAGKRKALPSLANYAENQDTPPRTTEDFEAEQFIVEAYDWLLMLSGVDETEHDELDARIPEWAATLAKELHRLASTYEPAGPYPARPIPDRLAETHLCDDCGGVKTQAKDSPAGWLACPDPDCSQFQNARPWSEESRYITPVAHAGEPTFAAIVRNRSGAFSGGIDFGLRSLDVLTSDRDRQEIVEVAYLLYESICREVGLVSARATGALDDSEKAHALRALDTQRRTIENQAARLEAPDVDLPKIPCSVDPEGLAELVGHPDYEVFFVGLDGKCPRAKVTQVFPQSKSGEPRVALEGTSTQVRLANTSPDLFEVVPTTSNPNIAI